MWVLNLLNYCSDDRIVYIFYNIWRKMLRLLHWSSFLKAIFVIFFPLKVNYEILPGSIPFCLIVVVDSYNLCIISNRERHSASEIDFRPFINNSIWALNSIVSSFYSILSLNWGCNDLLLWDLMITLS